MNKFVLLLLSIPGSIILFTSCNPECNTPFSIESASSVIAAGSEVLLRTNDDKFLDQLNGRKVFVNNRPLDDSASVFYPDFGLVVKMPNNITGMANLTVEDNDCGRLNVNVDVQDPSFFVNNPNFIAPAPPDIVIPTIPPVFPADITNAWVSPQNPDYCLWFGPFERYDFIKDGRVVFSNNTNILADGSFELSTCGNTNQVYHNNSFFGIVDFENDYIEITIDRSAKKGKTTLLRENFVGQFIDINKTNHAWGPINPCTAQGPNNQQKRTHMIWLVSKQTGRQVVVYKLL